MYPSDYGYSADLTKCTETLSSYSADTTNCTGTDWLFNQNSRWFLTQVLSSRYGFGAWYVSNGSVTSGSVDSEFDVLPVLYLKSNLVLDSGDGSSVESAYVVR